MTSNLPDRAGRPIGWRLEPPDPLTKPELYDGVLWRRGVAFCIDACLLLAVAAFFWFFAIILNVLTFFIFAGIIALVWAAPMFIVYDVAMVGGPRSATFGMQRMGIEMRSWQGNRPGYLHALISSALFWFLVPLTGGLILLVGVFSDRRRQLHDLLSGTLVVNAKPGPD